LKPVRYLRRPAGYNNGMRFSTQSTRVDSPSSACEAGGPA
jgi:hypothetical protein